jgi:hypothetical protein
VGWFLLLLEDLWASGPTDHEQQGNAGVGGGGGGMSTLRDRRGVSIMHTSMVLPKR